MASLSKEMNESGNKGVAHVPRDLSLLSLQEAGAGV